MVGHDTTADLFHNRGVCLMVQSGSLSSPLHKLCSESLGRGIIDLGCTDTMCGEFWLDHYLRKLGPDGSDVRRSDTNAWFVFGDGGVSALQSRLTSTDWWSRAVLTYARGFWGNTSVDWPAIYGENAHED